MSEKLVVIGDGAMGTVCSMILAQKGYGVRWWGYSGEQMGQIERDRENKRFFPGYKLPLSIEVTADDTRVFDDVGLVISAVPCKFVRGVWERLAGVMGGGLPVVSITKGIENNTLMRPTQIIAEVTGERKLAALSGPNIADELARGLPATSTVASVDEALAEDVQKLFSTNWLRIYTNSDIVGVELAGATKNVIAIAAGIIDGMQMGDNAKAALLTRGLVEISRLGVAMGAQADTFTGLSGMGDLVTTCVSPKGRNRTFGSMIGKGMSVAEALGAIAGEVEGVNTCRSVVKLAEDYQVEMPITLAVAGILFEGKSVEQALGELMTRKLKAEGEVIS